MDKEGVAGELIEWLKVERISRSTGFPGLVRKVFEHQAESMGSAVMSPFTFATTMVNVVLIETGFVPVVGEEVGVSANELMAMSTDSRISRLISELCKAFETQKTLSSFKYRYILEDKTESSDDSPPKYKFGEEVQLVVVPDGLEISISLVGTSRKKNIKMWLNNIVRFHKIKKPATYTLDEFLTEGTFNATGFSQDLKQRLIYYFLDACDAISSDRRFLQSLPDVVLTEICKRMDMKSFLKFTQTSKKFNTFSFNETIWKAMIYRIPIDFPNYDLDLFYSSPIDPNLILARNRSDEECTATSTFYQIYRNEYKSAFEFKMDHPRPGPGADKDNGSLNELQNWIENWNL